MLCPQLRQFAVHSFRYSSKNVDPEKNVTFRSDFCTVVREFLLSCRDLTQFLCVPTTYILSLRVNEEKEEPLELRRIDSPVWRNFYLTVHNNSLDLAATCLVDLLNGIHHVFGLDYRSVHRSYCLRLALLIFPLLISSISACTLFCILSWMARPANSKIF